MDRLAGMELFVKVAELGSYSATARMLGVSKSAVSKHVAALEERLGARLLNRTTRRLALTEVGEAYRESCLRIIAEIEDAESFAGRHGTEPRGRLKVSAPMTFGFMVIAPAIPELLRRHPLLEVELSLDDRVVDLLGEGLDLAVRVGKLRDSSLIARKLGVAQTVCAASAAYLQGTGPPRDPADLGAHNCLVYTYGRNPELWEFQRGAERRSVRVRGSFCANNGDALRAAAVGGLGVALVPDFILGDDIEAGRLTRLLADWSGAEIPIHAVFPPQRHPSAKLRVFIDFLVERLGRSCRRRAAPTAVERVDIPA